VADEQAGRLIRLGVAALAAVTSAFACSRLFGQGGTLIGTGAGAVISGAAAELYGHVMVKAKRHARAAVAAPRPGSRLLAEVTVGGLLVAVAAYAVVWGVEAAAGRPLSAVTTGSSVRGNSFTGVSPDTPAPVPPPEPSQVAPTLPGPPETTASAAPSAAPDTAPAATSTGTPFATSPPDTVPDTPTPLAPPDGQQQMEPSGPPPVTSSP
jgi:hypothetical protein